MHHASNLKHKAMSSTTERHPLQPFLPANAKILMLGSFPPPKARWSMEFFYPNWIYIANSSIYLSYKFKSKSQ